MRTLSQQAMLQGRQIADSSRTKGRRLVRSASNTNMRTLSQQAMLQGRQIADSSRTKGRRLFVLLQIPICVRYHNKHNVTRKTNCRFQ